jgi:hypothetical protein
MFENPLSTIVLTRFAGGRDRGVWFLIRPTNRATGVVTTNSAPTFHQNCLWTDGRPFGSYAANTFRMKALSGILRAIRRVALLGALQLVEAGWFDGCRRLQTLVSWLALEPGSL